MADFAEIFNIKINDISITEIFELRKLLPSTARINDGVGTSESIAMIEFVQRTVNTPKGKKTKKLQHNWTKEEEEKVKNMTREEVIKQSNDNYKMYLKRKKEIIELQKANSKI